MENRNNRSVVTVKNTYSNKDVNLEKIFEKGTSNKKEHSGFGLWELRKYVKNSTNLDLYTSKDDTYFKNTVSKIIETRENAKKELKKLGFSFTDSKTNFIFATHERMPAKEIFEKLKKKNIFVRYFNKPGIDNYLRITVGTDEEMKKLYKALQEILQKQIIYKGEK